MGNEDSWAGLLQQWFTVLERCHPTSCTVSDLIVGNSYSFRVFSENLCGLSASAAVTKELAHIVKTGRSGSKTRKQARHHHARLFHALECQHPSLGASHGSPLARTLAASPHPGHRYVDTHIHRVTVKDGCG